VGPDARRPDPETAPSALDRATRPPQRAASRPPAPDTVGGLPRRVRQANLAPQLREDSAGRNPGNTPAVTAEDIERDADEVRDRMASLQRGWQRGRRQNAEDVTGPGDTAPGTTPGGDGR
ncbi:histidine kinase, partial [Streptomyces sp. NPDC005899]